MKLLRIHPSDNVAVDTETGHKTALCNIAEGEAVIKYGFPIGHATKPIQKGERVHTDNLRTSLSGKLSYRYEPSERATEKSSRPVPMIRVYQRENGEIGVRNDIFIINTVGCVNRVAERIAELTGAYAFPHPYGCSQLGDDHTVTQKILKGLVTHPNAGGVLVLGLGCENNNIEAFRKILGPIDGRRIRFLNAQDCEDEITEGVRLVRELQGYAAADERTLVPLSQLKIGLKCGGSDGLSGITANPLIGRFTDLFTDMGGSAVLTEVPEMFGAETILMNRCVDETVFEKTVSLINGFKDYFTAHGQEIYENPSRGNKAGGITTLEEKSLGCIEKGGHAPVTDVLTYGDRVTKSGLTLLDGPGNDIVAELKRRMDEAKSILWIFDNCGEAVFDRLLMEPYREKLTLAVRGKPAFNDLTRAELEESGFPPDFRARGTPAHRNDVHSRRRCRILRHRILPQTN